MIWILLIWLGIVGDPALEDTKVYEVKRIDADFEIDGQGSNEIWNKAGLLSDFQLPWADAVAQPTFFRALWSEEYYYFYYDVVDLDIVTPSNKAVRKDIPLDRIEIFFKSNGEMDPYYCLEMGPAGRVLDYVAKTYRDFDFDWTWPDQQLEVKSRQMSDRYHVEGRISLTSLRTLGILNATGEMDAGLFRGDFFRTSDSKSQVRWISWVHPESEEPDFHIPSAFGKLILVE